MSKLPAISGILRCDYRLHRRVTVPNHKEIAKGTLRAILRKSGLTVEEFLELM